MKTAIIYFSISGNTKKIGEALCYGLKQEGVDSALISVSQYDGVSDKKTILESDLIGIGVPVHFFKLPVNLPSFILEQLPDISGKHVFLFCTLWILPLSLS